MRENSSTSSLPPGRSTRAHFSEAASLSVMLRRPKATRDDDRTCRSANGSCSASHCATGRLQPASSRRRAAGREHRAVDVGQPDLAAVADALREGACQVAGPAGDVEHLHSGSDVGLTDGEGLPQAMQARRTSGRSSGRSGCATESNTPATRDALSVSRPARIRSAVELGVASTHRMGSRPHQCRMAADGSRGRRRRRRCIAARARPSAASARGTRPTGALVFAPEFVQVIPGKDAACRGRPKT